MTFTGQTIQANGIAQHFYRSGGDKPPLVMLHGFTDSGSNWFPLAEPLARDYDVILPDARGHGKSARIEGIGFRTMYLVDDAAALIQALDLKRPAVLGHSMGGLTALLLAANYPDLVGCLLLEDPAFITPPTPEAEAERVMWLRQWGEGLRQMQQKPFDVLIQEEHQRSPLWSADELRWWAEAKTQVDLAVFVENAPFPDWRLYLPRVQCPVLLLYGDNGTIIDEARAQEAASIWKQGQAVQITGAGHCIRRDNPPDFLRAVRDFLSKHHTG